MKKKNNKMAEEEKADVTQVADPVEEGAEEAETETSA